MMTDQKKPLTADELDLAFALARGREAGLVRDVKTTTRTQIIILRETIAESLVIDGSTFGCALGITLLGHWLDSSAAQWFCLITLSLGVFWRSAGKANRMSISEARAELDRIEKVEMR